MKYVKDVSLRTQSILRSHGRLADVNDIVRINISSFLARMGQPIQDVDTYSHELGRITTVTCPKSYHVNLVMVLMAEGKAASVDRFRLIMDKRGVRSIQEVELVTELGSSLVTASLPSMQANSPPPITRARAR